MVRVALLFSLSVVAISIVTSWSSSAAEIMLGAGLVVGVAMWYWPKEGCMGQTPAAELGGPLQTVQESSTTSAAAGSTRHEREDYLAFHSDITGVLKNLERFTSNSIGRDHLTLRTEIHNFLKTYYGITGRPTKRQCQRAPVHLDMVRLQDQRRVLLDRIMSFHLSTKQTLAVNRAYQQLSNITYVMLQYAALSIGYQAHYTGRPSGWSPSWSLDPQYSMH
jgi:hypothetical protein